MMKKVEKTTNDAAQAKAYQKAATLCMRVYMTLGCTVLSKTIVGEPSDLIWINMGQVAEEWANLCVSAGLLTAGIPRKGDRLIIFYACVCTDH